MARLGEKRQPDNCEEHQENESVKWRITDDDDDNSIILHYIIFRIFRILFKIWGFTHQHTPLTGQHENVGKQDTERGAG